MEAALLIIREDSHPRIRGADMTAGRPSCEKSAKSGVRRDAHLWKLPKAERPSQLHASSCIDQQDDSSRTLLSQGFQQRPI